MVNHPFFSILIVFSGAGNFCAFRFACILTYFWLRNIVLYIETQYSGYAKTHKTGEPIMRKKCLAIWILITFTFIALIHLIEAITVIMLNNPIRIVQLYPFIG